MNRDDKFFDYIARKAIIQNIQVKSFGLKKNADLYLKKIIKNKNIYQASILYHNKIYQFNINYNNSTYIQNVLSTCLILLNLNLDILHKKNIFLILEFQKGGEILVKLKFLIRKFIYWMKVITLIQIQ